MSATPTQNGRATTVKTTFSRETAVSIEVKADPAIVWKLLTTAEDFPRWNSTILSINGTIGKGQKIQLTSTLAPKRVFKLNIKEMDTEKRLAWGDGMGTRVYTISKNSSDSVVFSMTEKIGGPLFPLFAKHIPPFDQSFEQFAADLKKEAEKIQSMKK